LAQWVWRLERHIDLRFYEFVSTKIYEYGQATWMKHALRLFAAANLGRNYSKIRSKLAHLRANKLRQFNLSKTRSPTLDLQPKN